MTKRVTALVAYVTMVTVNAIYTVYQLVRTNEVIEAITIPYILSSVLNAIWILCWHFDLIWLSVIVMIGILLSLIRIVDTVHAHGVTIGNGPLRYLVQRAPFSVYFGWICVATVANVSAFVISVGWRGSGFSEEIWTVLTLVVAAADGWDGQYGAVIAATTILLIVLAVGATAALLRDVRTGQSV